MIDRYRRSALYYERALRVIPGGTQTLSKRADRFPGYYPRVVGRGLGAKVWDVDGNEYVDWICGLASITLGYRHPDVEQVVRDQLGEGAAFPLAHPTEIILAERLVDAIPCAEMVRFVKTGSEAAEAAIRVARKATGRDVIVSIGYHSWHSWYAATRPVHPGVPLAMLQLAVDFPWGTLGEVETYVRGFPVAAVFVEPVNHVEPPAGYLEGLRVLCDQTGTVLIFDEVVSGYRWARGGAQEKYGVTPDLATFGKAMANGYAIGALVGKRELMEHADVVSGTFGGDAIGLAAALAVLEIYARLDVIGRIWETGALFRESLSHVFAGRSIPVEIAGTIPRPLIRFGDDPDGLRLSLFVQQLAEYGVLWHPSGGNVSAALRHGELNETISAIVAALDDVEEEVERGTIATALVGGPIAPAPFRLGSGR